LLTYAATLISHLFRIGIVIAAHFNLKVKQHNIINAFIYAFRQLNELPITYYMPNGFLIPGMLIEVKQALYSLIDSPLL
jgi:hypothetical protein